MCVCVCVSERESVCITVITEGEMHLRGSWEGTASVGVRGTMSKNDVNTIFMYEILKRVN